MKLNNKFTYKKTVYDLIYINIINIIFLLIKILFNKNI